MGTIAVDETKADYKHWLASVYVFVNIEIALKTIGIKMTNVISFRPSKEEERAIERARTSLGAKSRAAAVKFLIRRGAQKTGSLADDPVWNIRAPKLFQGGPSRSSREIDEELYGERR